MSRSGPELARRLDVARQGAAKTLAVLERRGYVERIADSADGRRKRLKATDRGLDLLRHGLVELVGPRAQDESAGWMPRSLGASG